MTDPTIVKTIENSFIPLLIHNNQGGADAKILKKYGEPAWNYQVIRFLTSGGKDIIPRKDGVNTRKALATRMVKALEKAKRPVPPELRKLLANHQTGKTRHIAFSQHCFWTGEAELGAIDGVLTTEAGWLDGHEVTLVTYDENLIDTRSLTQKAKHLKVANQVYVADVSQQKALAGIVKKPGKLTTQYRAARASDQKKQISGTPFARLKLTPEQACKVNAHCRTNPKKALSYLTAQQRKHLGR